MSPFCTPTAQHTTAPTTNSTTTTNNHQHPNTNPPNTPTTTAAMSSTLPTPSDVNAMPYKVLQTTLKTLNQPATGGTLQLKQRLLAYLQSQTQPAGPGEPAAPEDAEPAAPAPPDPASVPTDSGQTATAVPVPAAAPAAAAAAAPLMSSSTALPAALVGSGLGTGTGGAGFPGPPEADDAEDADDDDAGDGDGDGAKSKKAAHFTLHEFTRMGHCMMVPELRTALASIMKGKSQEQIDAGYNGWDDFAEYFNNPENIFLHPELGQTGQYEGSPRIDTRGLDPNKLSEKRSAKQLKAKWAELKKYLTKYFANWNASGQMTADVAEKSISDFLCVGQKHPKERLIKYIHLIFKGDEDLMCFASKLIGEHGVESGVTKPQGGGASGGGSGGKKRKHLDGDALAAAMATESPAQKKMAAAWETEAAAKSAEVALQLIQQLDSAPDAFKPLLEARIKKLLEDGNGPEAPPAAQ